MSRFPGQAISRFDHVHTTAWACSNQKSPHVSTDFSKQHRQVPTIFGQLARNPIQTVSLNYVHEEYEICFNVVSRVCMYRKSSRYYPQSSSLFGYTGGIGYYIGIETVGDTSWLRYQGWIYIYSSTAIPLIGLPIYLELSRTSCGNPPRGFFFGSSASEL